ncbi:Alanyl-tRNA editing protein Aarsd1-B [Gryllus bimaculatus]|nr:Alanyl-tRNA editing protein Aarsd1-B [Gryllus bimaculatus]
MVFACQRDSFLKEFKSTVLSCTPSELETTVNGKKEIVKGYEVILDDTILFPEGGGQPCDQGLLGDVEVIQVTRRGTQAVHFAVQPVPEGSVVDQHLDWNRRLDHMQQHSGQHLISALGETVFKYPTTSWWLGTDTSYIELDTSSLTQSEVDEWEKLANEKIRAALPVAVTVYERDDPSLSEAHTRGLPDDHVGPVRVITIDGVDTNMCCGTHVNNLSQLQVIKMLHFEKGKKNKINLHFLVGNRVLNQMATLMKRESSLTTLLKNSPSVHFELVDKLQKSLKVTNKKLATVLKELAVYEAQKLLSLSPRPKLYETLFLITVGDEKGAGQMTMYGDPELIAELGHKICEILDGKGAGKGQKFQAKVSNLAKRNEAVKLIKKHFESCGIAV